MISDISPRCHVIIVCQRDQYIASSESIERVVAPSLNVRVVPNLIALSHGHKCSHVLVQIAVGIEGGPKGLTVGGIITTLKTLL